MRRVMLLLGVGLAACAAEPVGDEASPAEEPTVAEDVAESFAYTPMGFARIAVNPNGVPSVAVKFNSSSGGAGIVTVGGGGGSYNVTFNGLGTGTLRSGEGGNVQVTAEGTSNVRCRLISWGGAPNVTVNVQCNLPDGTALGTPFAVGLYQRITPTTPTTFPTTTAYAWVTAAGAAPASYNYNSSGVLNTVTAAPPGKYTVGISNASAVNASMMVTPYGGAAAGNVCSVVSWGSGLANIECRDRTGVLVDSAFSFSYSITGPAPSQQGGHAWFDGTSAHPTYSAGLAKVECSSVSVTGSRVGSLATVIVAGDLGPWDATPFVRASFANSYGAAGYCKVETLTAGGAPPVTTGTTTVRCYTATGAVVAVPRFTLTHETSDASGPC